MLANSVPLSTVIDSGAPRRGTIPEQYQTVRQILTDSPVDLIVTEVYFWGVFPLLLGPRDARPPILTFGVLPLILSSRDVSPFSGPTIRVRKDCFATSRRRRSFTRCTKPFKRGSGVRRVDIVINPDHGFYRVRRQGDSGTDLRSQMLDEITLFMHRSWHKKTRPFKAALR